MKIDKTSGSSLLGFDFFRGKNDSKLYFLGVYRRFDAIFLHCMRYRWRCDYLAFHFGDRAIRESKSINRGRVSIIFLVNQQSGRGRGRRGQ